MIKYIDELEKKDLKGKRVLLRLDLNVPVADGKITDANRVERVIETIDFLRLSEAQTIIISHIEDSAGNDTSLLPVQHYLNGFFPVDFCETFFTPFASDKLLNLKDKGILLFENIRNNPGEKENDKGFAKKLSAMADIFVNDAFSVSHRKHASVVGVPEFLPHYGGLLMRQEIEHLSKIFSPVHPFVFILGGAKFDTKIPIIKKYLEIADKVFVAGALVNNIFKERGFEVGTSLVSSGDFNLKEMLSNPKLITPVDVTVTKKNSEVLFKSPDKIDTDESVVDICPETLEQMKELLKDAKTLVWNGPLGNYELGFKDKTESLAQIVAKFTAGNGLESVVGGGDTVASINALGLERKFSFLSTGGGAMLDFLVDETLVGIEALKK